MMFYFLLFFFALLGSFINLRKINVILALSLLTIMCLRCALRDDSVGVDTSMYLNIYDSKDLINRFSSEYLFFFIIKCFQNLNVSPEGCQVFITVVTFIPLGWIAITKTQNPCLVVLMLLLCVNGYYFETFNISRQTVATAYLLCAYVWLDEHKIKLAILAIVIAAGFHTTTIIYLPFIFIAYKFTFSNRFVYIALFASLIFAFFISNVNLISNLINTLSNLKIGGTEKYQMYTKYRLDMARNTNGLITLLIPTSAICAYSYNQLKQHISMRIFFLGAVFLNLISIMPTSYRMAFGMVCIEILVYPWIISRVNNQQKLVPISIISVLILLWLYRLKSMLDIMSLLPYERF